MAFEIISLPQGDSFSRGYSALKDEFGVLATDLSGWNFVATLKTDPEDADVDALLTSITAQMNVNNTTLEVGVIWTPAQLAALTVGQTVYYAFKAKTPSGFVGTLEESILCKTISARQTF